jgi:Tfp pilus assembly major pilin PilA
MVGEGQREERENDDDEGDHVTDDEMIWYQVRLPMVRASSTKLLGGGGGGGGVHTAAQVLSPESSFAKSTTPTTTTVAAAPSVSDDTTTTTVAAAPSVSDDTVRAMRMPDAQRDAPGGIGDEATIRDDAGDAVVQLGSSVVTESSPPGVVRPPSLGRRRLSMRDAQVSAIDLIARRHGFRDRKTGGFGVPPEDTKEPERTERMLASPLALQRKRTGDAFHAIEGFLAFRVNGSSRIGACYRLLVVALNIGFGVLSGLNPLLPPGSVAAVVQSFIVLVLQLGMSYVCFRFLPDADRMISRFAGTQFLFEGLASASLLLAAAHEAATREHTLNVSATAAVPLGSPSLSTDGGGASDAHSEEDVVRLNLQLLGLALALIALIVPIVQLLEQRAVTPTINLVHNRGGNPLVLLAALYMLVASLPKKLMILIGRGEAGAIDAQTAAESASADAGDDAVEGGAGGGAGDIEVSDFNNADGGGAGVGDAAEVGDATPAEVEGGGSVELAGDVVAETAVRVSRLLARALGAKEANGQTISPDEPQSAHVPAAIIEEEEVEETVGISSSISAVRAAARLRQQQARERQMSAVADGGDDAGDDGDGGE